MPNLKERIKHHVSMLCANCVQKSTIIENVYYLECDSYKVGVNPPDVKNLGRPFAQTDKWAGKPDYHGWFYFEIDVPKLNDNERAEVCIYTSERGWDSANPQFIVYMDGRTEQGLDTNHRSFVVSEGKHEIYVYAYNGFVMSGSYDSADKCNKLIDFNALLNVVNIDIENFYVDLVIGYDVLEYSLHQNTRVYASLLETALFNVSNKDA